MDQQISTMKTSSAKCNISHYHRVDLLKPKEGLQFTLEDFLKRKREVGVFINALIDLNKMLAYDQRDPY